MKIIEEKILQQKKWILVKEKIYNDRHGIQSSWVYIERRNRQKAAVIVPVTSETGSLIVIKQFRVPLGKEIYEFPAGLIDEGETAEQAASRELLEETGYSGVITALGPEIVSSSGLSTETVYLVYMETEEFPSTLTSHEGSEQIEVIKIPREAFSSFISDAAEHKILLDAKLYIYLNEH